MAAPFSPAGPMRKIVRWPEPLDIPRKTLPLSSTSIPFVKETSLISRDLELTHTQLSRAAFPVTTSASRLAKRRDNAERPPA